MVDNASKGMVQIFDNSVESINYALRELSERGDELSGLRGRSMIWDRTRVDSPAADSDAVDLQSLLTQESRFRQQLIDAPGLIVADPTTSYTEISQYFRQNIDWSDLTSPEARLIVRGWGTESGAGKGVSLHDGTSVICEVTWDGQGETTNTGTFTSVSLTADTQMRLYAKGSSATEDLILMAVVLEVKVAIQVVTS